MLKTISGALTVLLLSPFSAQADGYLFDTGNRVVYDGAGDCVYTSFWDPQDAIAGCDNVVSVVESEPIEFAAVEPREPIIKRVTLDTETHFDFDKATLKPEGMDKLNEVVSTLRGYDRVLNINITGHADQIGDESYNRQLALERALAVKNYLTERGSLDPNLLEMVSMGEDAPLVSCEGMRGQQLIDCLAPNRRVELDISADAVE